ncbi:MAG: hypothetical protein F4043_00050, partial [Gammaproteobacteria bacterium]|nr:hypothetical protein [Gammaproteobacteria bacterium]
MKTQRSSTTRSRRGLLSYPLTSAMIAGAALLVAGHAHAQSALETAISHLEYRELGPALMGGRIAAIAVVESKPQIFYIGTGTGGVWKTE